eukprot:CAMPEP_0173432404 /NCGR_PEP_ID=MMETSP1357-20121228/10216_1 /TAXON_ID=77926 /ORGANISM="Hemiselmis rufescens, Strain PCC563" /LENGTH=160 /DNA_ID=CAMNT_0014396991 /DNA_START=55 /DNA_END=538 /DNA_ORIENTATION=-
MSPPSPPLRIPALHENAPLHSSTMTSSAAQHSLPGRFPRRTRQCPLTEMPLAAPSPYGEGRLCQGNAEASSLFGSPIAAALRPPHVASSMPQQVCPWLPDSSALLPLSSTPSSPLPPTQLHPSESCFEIDNLTGTSNCKRRRLDQSEGTTAAHLSGSRNP